MGGHEDRHNRLMGACAAVGLRPMNANGLHMVIEICR